MVRHQGTPVTGPVLIIGAGLLGASIGLGLRAQGVETVLADISPTVEAVAQDIGAGRSLRALGGRLGAGAEGLPPQLDPELVILATPPDVVAEGVVRALQDFPRATVVDIASVKAPVLAEVRASGVPAARYVGTHPMAGREKSGPVAARGELFTSRPWVVCEREDADPASVALAHGLAAALGGSVTYLEATAHDATVALVSHLPQVMSSLLASRLRDTPLEALGLAGQGLRDTTRIAASDPGLWVQILAANAEPVVGTLYGVREDLDRLIRTLEDPEAAGARLDLAQLMAEGNDGVARIPGKHGGAPKAFSELTVLVDDAPGQVARLLGDIGRIGVNLEDLRMEHSPEQPVGMVVVQVVPTAHEKLVHELTALGWRIAK